MENENETFCDGLKWDDSYLIGNELIDTQHLQLFDLLNTLVRSCDEESENIKIKVTLDFLVSYAIQHFNDEEALQLECGFPEYNDHKQKHDELKASVNELIQRFNESGSSSELGTDIKKFVIKWLIHHFISEDKKIGLHLKGM